MEFRPTGRVMVLINRKLRRPSTLNPEPRDSNTQLRNIPLNVIGFLAWFKDYSSSIKGS